MKTFTQFITEAVISASGMDAARHVKKYVTPYLPGGEKHSKQGTHTLADSGESVVLHSHSVENGKHSVLISRVGSKQKTIVPVNKLNKPGTTVENKGHQYETQTFERFKQHGLVPAGHKPAGSTAGTDVPILNKKKKEVHQGSIVGAVHSGEVKLGTSAAFGQLTIHHDPEKGGWHIPEKSRQNRPQYAKEIEKAGIIDHLNSHHNPSKKGQVKATASGKAQNVVMSHENLHPAEAYLKDHGVQVLQVGEGHGTYRVGHKDVTGHGLPRMSGSGKWTVRQKTSNPMHRTVMFQPSGKAGLTPSHVNLDTDDHMHEFKKTLGHTN